MVSLAGGPGVWLGEFVVEGTAEAVGGVEVDAVGAEGVAYAVEGEEGAVGDAYLHGEGISVEGAADHEGGSGRGCGKGCGVEGHRLLRNIIKIIYHRQAGAGGGDVVDSWGGVGRWIEAVNPGQAQGNAESYQAHRSQRQQANE